MAAETKTTNDLIYLLKKQYPDGVTTFSPCPACGTNSRGGGLCAKCVCSELSRRGVNEGLVSGLHLLLEQRRDINHRINSVGAKIEEDAEEMQKWATTVEDGPTP